jgi:hypothetical protein
MKELKGKFYKTSEGFNSYEVVYADSTFVIKIVTVITEKFHFTHANPVIGLEQVFMDFEKDKVKITVGWDIWSGCFVMAHDNLGDKYIEEIGNFLDEHLNML